MVQRDMTDDEVKGMLNHIRLNTGFSFPDQLIQDFMDGDIVPTFKKCLHFNRDDFRTLLHPILKKKARKRIERPKTQVARGQKLRLKDPSKDPSKDRSKDQKTRRVKRK